MAEELTGMKEEWLMDGITPKIMKGRWMSMLKSINQRSFCQLAIFVALCTGGGNKYSMQILVLNFVFFS